MKIFLTGYRASGKTTVGKILAGRVSYAFLDLDKKVEKETESTIQDIVEIHGWPYFRQLEQKALFSTKDHDNIVVSTGGGIISARENIEFMLANGYSIWLKADINTILSRLNSDSADPERQSSRPRFTDKNLLEETRQTLIMRTPLYEKACHMSIDTDTNSPEELAVIIERSLS